MAARFRGASVYYGQVVRVACCDLKTTCKYECPLESTHVSGGNWQPLPGIEFRDSCETRGEFIQKQEMRAMSLRLEPCPQWDMDLKETELKKTELVVKWGCHMRMLISTGIRRFSLSGRRSATLCRVPVAEQQPNRGRSPR